MTERRTQKRRMTAAEDRLWRLWQGGQRLERYVEEFLKLANWMSWHDTALGVCFLLGLDDEPIRCDLPRCDFPLIELVNLILYLNGSDLEVEEIKENSKSRRPGPSVTPRISQLIPCQEHPHTSPTAPTTCPTPGIPASSEAPP